MRWITATGSPPRAATVRLVSATLCGFALMLGVPGASDAGEEHERILEGLVGRLGDSPRDVVEVLKRYSRLEDSSRLDIYGRREVHEGLLEELRRRGHPSLEEAAERVFDLSERSYFAAQVLMMKATIGSKFPGSRDRKTGWLLEKARSTDDRISRWALHLLAETRWSGAIDGMLDLLAELEREGDRESLLWHVTSTELYRALGRIAASRDATRTREQWEASDRKVPRDPDYTLDRETVTVTSFFGDPISPRAAFLIDTSTSMLQRTTLRAGKRGVTRGAGPRGGGSEERKVDIVKEELVHALHTLRPGFEFNVLVYNASYRPWQGSPRRVRLVDVTSASLREAITFARGLEVSPGTNIHDTTVAALEIPEVETVYLLSDGVPSRGPKQAEILRRVRAMNYLLGARIVTYGFTATEGGSFDEGFMKKLATENWGWYRRLN